jgi:hypothetical protein
MSLPEGEVTLSAGAAEDEISTPAWLPPELIELFERVWRELPAFPDRRTAGNVWSRHVHPWSRRTLEALPLPTRQLNGRACFERRAFLEYGFRRIVDAPSVRGGRAA